MAASVIITRDRVRQGPVRIEARPNYPTIVIDAAGPARAEEQLTRLGDRVEHALTAIGVTKERWVALKQELGGPPTCNCVQRQAWLNALDEKLGLGEKLAAIKKVLW